MSYQNRNRIKALILLVVFSLNTIAGFACSIGVDMGYNTKHHEHGKHNHDAAHKHAPGHKHTHSHSVIAGSKMSAPVDDCCSGQVNSFALLDKSVVYNNLLLQAPAFFLKNYISSVAPATVESGISVNSRFQFVRRSCSLDDTDIRIVIQSFQI
jgi:hypothetical protein